VIAFHRFVPIITFPGGWWPVGNAFPATANFENAGSNTSARCSKIHGCRNLPTTKKPAFRHPSGYFGTYFVFVNVREEIAMKNFTAILERRPDTHL
jgi:hypothetical protein